MSTSLAVVLAVAVVPTQAGAPRQGDAAELAKLEGAWKAVKLQVGAKAVDLTALEWIVTFNKGRWTMRSPDGAAEGKVVLDMTKTPHRLDLVAAKGTFYCVYSVNKGELRLCWWGTAADRQDTLDPSKQKPPGLLLVMVRAKDGPAVNARAQVPAEVAPYTQGARRPYPHQQRGAGSFRHNV